MKTMQRNFPSGKEKMGQYTRKENQDNPKNETSQEGVGEGGSKRVKHVFLS